MKILFRCSELVFLVVFDTIPLVTTVSREKAAPSPRASAGFLFIANLVPLVGVLFWEWKVLDIVAIYWAENLIIGFYNALRIACVHSPSAVLMETAEKVFVIPFFIVHYGGFCAGHGVFIFTLLGGDRDLAGMKEAVGLLLGPLLWPIVGLFVSHGFSFFWNFLRRGEYKETTVSKQMFAPYARIVALHIAILLGGFAVEAAGQPIFLLVILVVGKTIVDMKIHLRSHREKSKGKKK